MAACRSSRLPRPPQGGAVTAIMVVLLLALIGTIALISERMAGSSVRDSGSQHGGVAALFVAESGLERVMKRYAGGTACAALVPDGPYSLGAGSFTVVSASDSGLPANQCRIAIRGDVANTLESRTLTMVALYTAGAGGGGGVVWDPGFNDPNRWDGDAQVSGGLLRFNKDDKDTKAEKKDPLSDPQNGIAEISPAPGSVSLTLRFDYVVSGTIQFQIQVKFEGSGTITVDTGDLTGSGIYTAAIGTRDPNTVKEITIKAQQITGAETATMDNLYVGPTGGGGGGGSGTSSIVSWSGL